MFSKIEKFLLLPIFIFPEGKIKSLLRKFMFKYVNELPYGMMVNYRETIIDVGTPYPKNVERFRHLVGSRGRVIVLEPEPTNIKNIKRYIKKKKWKNVYLIGKAAWREAKILNFLLSVNPADHKIPIENIVHDNDLDPNRKYIEEIKIGAIPLDNLKELIGKVDYLYITVNGAELNVLRGARKILKSSNPRLWIKGHARINNEPLNKKLVEFLKPLGYNTVITRSSRGIVKSWEKRDGDVYAWKNIK